MMVGFLRIVGFEGFMDRFIRTENNVFGRVKDWWYRMEYQKRGGIHIHMVIWWDEERSPKEQKISAEMPRFKDPNDPTKPHPMNDLWREAVLQTQIHHCFDSRCLRGPGRTRLKNCKYGFPFDLCLEERLDKTGIRYEYPRSDIEDVSVSPYVLELLLYWQGHVNVQRVTKHGWEMYLAKYIAKCESAEDIQLVKISPALGGEKRAPPSDAAVVPADGKDNSANAQPVLPDQNDEPPPEKVPYGRVTKDDSDVKRFLKLRVVNILEAVMLCFGYPQVGCSRLIIFLPIDIVPASRVVMRKKHREAAKGDSPYYDTKLDKYFSRSELLEDVTYQQYFEQYYVKYDKKLAPEEPDDYAREDEEETMRKNNPTFFVDQTAAKRKWVRRANPARYAIGRFRYFAPHGDNVESYCLVKLLRAKPARRSTVEGWIAEFGSYLSACVHLGLVEKGAEALHFLEECAMEGFGDLRLREMVQRFKEQGWLEDPDIDGLLETLAPAHRAIRKAREDVIAQVAADAAEMEKEVETIPLDDFLNNMTPSQRSAFTYATDKWEAGQPVRLLITGGAGVGKSYLLKALVAWLRDRHITFAKCATTGIAAHLIGGRTVHNFLGMDFEFKSRIQHGTFQAKALSDTQVVFVDEVSMMPREALTMLDETLREFNNQNNGAPFAGKSIVLLGDPAQLQAVGKHIWREAEFSVVVVSRECEATERITLLHPSFGLTACSWEPHRCRHADCLEHGLIHPLEKLDGPGHGFFLSGRKRTPTTEYFALMEKRGRIPAACLSLRVGTKLMLLRNLPNGQANFGWVNGAMCIVEELTDDCIIVYMQSHPKRRLPFKRLQHDLPSNRGPKSQRWQFPFDLAYGCTVHKA
ncbi:hypothetical protein BV898_19921, partial [Hypsibius exemplaris]